MKANASHFAAGLFLPAFFVFSGCYTQLAVYDGIDAVEGEQAPPDTVVHEQGWNGPRYDPWITYPPVYGSRFYFGLSFSAGDPFWYPGYYRPYRPCWSYPWYGWAYGFDPWWYDPWWYDPWWYGPFYYGPYYSAYGFGPWWWATPYTIYEEPIPRKKRDWDRRGADPLVVRGRSRSPDSGPQAALRGRPGGRGHDDARKVQRETESIRDSRKPEKEEIHRSEITRKARHGVIGEVGRLIVRSISGERQSKGSSPRTAVRRSRGGSHSPSRGAAVTPSRPSVTRSHGSHASPGRSSPSRSPGSSRSGGGSRSRSKN